MNEEATARDWFDWRLPLYGTAGALVLSAVIIIDGNDVVEVFYVFVAVPIISFVLGIVAIRKKGRRRLALLAMLVAYWAISWALFQNSFELRTSTRWLVWSKDYKTKVLAQPNSASGTLKHVEWDGWGFPGGGNTVVYVVFDPNDSLWTAAKSDSSGKFSGIRCEVFHVRRLESHYYSVLFYTDTDWDHCN